MDASPDEKRLRYSIALAALVIVLAAVGMRFVRIRQWPIAFALPVQYESAVTARVFWLSLDGGRLTQEQQMWLDAKPHNITAPPLMQAIVAAVYYLIGKEQPWVSSLLASIFWLAGGWFLFDLCRELAEGSLGALVALAFYLLTPMGIIVSRSFQPEALMTFGFLIALWYLLKFESFGSLRGSVAAGIISGLAVLIKPGFYLLPLLAAYLVLSWNARGARRTFASPGLYVFIVLTCLPSVLYAFLFLSNQFDRKLIPQLLLSIGFYRYWYIQVTAVMDLSALFCALVGACVMMDVRRSPLGLGLLAGYVAYSLAFTWHTMSHSYYQVPLIPILAICLAPLSERMLRAVPWDQLSSLSKWYSLSLLAAFSLIYAWPATQFDQPMRVEKLARMSDEIGMKLGRGTKVICLVDEYDPPLSYHGWLVARYWPFNADKVHEKVRTGSVVEDRKRLRQMIAESNASYFVITLFDEVKGQPQLAKLLETHFPIYYRDKEMLIYDLRKPLRPLDRP